MFEHYVMRLGRVRRRTLLVVVALMAPLAAIGGVASPVAMAAPQGAYAVFSQCPTGTPGVDYCLFAQITSGELVFGRLSIPVDRTIVLQGGAISIAPNVLAVAPAKNGESLSKTELNVPGGLPGLIGCAASPSNRRIFWRVRWRPCQAILDSNAMSVTATIETVASSSNPATASLVNILGEHGAGLTLPVRVHLNNPWLGSGCYIGSESSPIELPLTDGTTSPPEPNKPITGKGGVFAQEEEDVFVVLENSMVENAFSVPAAEGCGGSFSSIVDPVIDSKLALPSSAGHNTAILNITHRIATAENVIKSEEKTIVKNEKPEQPASPTPPWRHSTGGNPSQGPRWSPGEGR